MRRRIVQAVALIAAAAGAAGEADAQVAAQRALTLEGARRVVAAVVLEAKKHDATGIVAVVDAGGNLMALERIDGSFPAGAAISIGKARTAALFRRPTRAFEELINQGRTAMTALSDFTPLIGGVPLTVDGEIVGGVGVSGASSAQQDEEFALAGAAALAAPAQPASAPSVLHWPKSRVTASFARGAVLFDGDGGRNYMIHTSRRDRAGLAEVHERDADLVYVQSGGATLVTGGTLVDPKPIGAGEFRGSAIAGGEARRIGPGDVLIVPRGTPHWFKEVQGPLTYYVVKVR